MRNQAAISGSDLFIGFRKRGDGLIEIILGVGGGDLGTYSRLAFRYHRIEKTNRVNAAFEQFL